MSSSCLSEATIVRCVALSKLQHGIVFVPAAVQIIFLATLTALYWRSGRRKHFMVLADGSAFYIIALLDLLSHLIPVARNHLDTFKIFDIVIGALSFVPILLYTTFLFFFSRSYFIPTLPRVPSAITKYAQLALIPVTIVTSELASFIGIGYKVLQNSQGQSYLAIGFGSGNDQTIWQFLTSLTLALLIVLQASMFFLSVYVAISLLQQRRTGHTLFEGHDLPTLSGVVWIAMGVKIGVIETLLGFVSGGFSIVLARRILRMVSRCCLAFGALEAEGARLSSGNGHRRSRTMSQIRAMISNPRASTFVRLSPTAEEFYSMPRATDAVRGEDEDSRLRPQRVTVHYDGQNAPELNLRLSVLDVPSAEVLTTTFDKRGTIIADASYERRRAGSESKQSSSQSLTRSLSAIAPRSVPMVDYSSISRDLRPVIEGRSRTNRTTDAMGTISSIRPNPKFSAGEEQRQSSGTSSDVLFPGGHRRFMSGSSLASDSLSIVNNLASRFPGIPPRRTASGRRSSFSEYRNTQAQSTVLDGVEEATEKGTIKTGVSPGNSIKRKPPPAISPTLPRDAAEEKLRQDRPRLKNSSSEGQLSQSSSMRRKRITLPPPIDSTIAGPDKSLAQRVSVTNEDTTPATTPYTGRSEHMRSYKYTSMRSTSTGATGTRAPQTPGMTYASGNSTMGPDSDVSTIQDTDPFADSDVETEQAPEYRISELATAESGLNTIASRVAQFDRQRRQLFRGDLQPSPVRYEPFETSPRERKGKSKATVEDDWSMVEFPTVNESLGVPIGRPRRLSALSSNSSSSLHNATAVSGRRVTVAARHGPTYSNATIVPSSAFSGAHAHTTSTSSAQTLVSHTERELMRIKSVGRVATRRTPVPTPSSGSFATRQSMRIESVELSAGESTDQESSESNSPASTMTRRRPQYESGGASPVTGVRSALREGWTASVDEEDITDRFRSRKANSLRQGDD
ncbi:hypothetical protein ACEPAI_2681 [Sanghuangporus weigelae]